MKRINRIGMLTMSLFVGILSASTVEAKSCKIYKDYDLFAETSDSSVYSNGIAAAEDGRFILSHTTQTPAGLSKDAPLIKEYQINVVKTNGATDEKTWTAAEYYENLNNLMTNGKTETLKTSPKDTTIRVYNIDNGKTESGEPIVIRYIRHGKWKKDGGSESDAAFVYDLTATNNLVNATIIPTGNLKNLTGTGTKVVSTKSTENSDYYDVTIERSIVAADINGLTTIVATNQGGTNQHNIFIAPAVYYREYEYCTYMAKIDYVYEDGTTAAETIEKSDLPDETTYPVDSPSIPNCTPDKSSVDVKIEGKDFHDVVTYKCKKSANEPPKMGPTGDALIYIAWAMGLATIAFVVYFYQKERKKNN